MATEPAAELPQDLRTALFELVQALDRRGIRYAPIGGLATGYRSRPRFTRAVDLLLAVSQVTLPGLLDDLRSRGFSFDPDKALREWTREHLTVLEFHGVTVDWLKPVLPCYQHVLASARPESWVGVPVRIASAEGLLLMKLLAFRTQDQLDIENLLAANRGQLDLEWVRREAETAVPAVDARWQRFEAMIEEFYKPPRAEGPA
jgi:hypothetical protein